MALKDQKPRMFSTYWDLVSMAQQIATENIDVSEQLPELFNVVKYKSQLEQFIIQVDAMAWAKLRRYYSFNSVLGLVENTRVSIPTPHLHNQGDTELISVSLDKTLDDIYTATWTIHFTSPSQYNIYSSLEGLQGLAWEITDPTRTSDNHEITIENSFWVTNRADFVAGDKIFFSVHRVHPLVQFVSNLLGTSLAMTSIYTSESPNFSDFGKTLWDRGMEQIHQIVLDAEGKAMENGIAAASLDDLRPAWDLTTIGVDYFITELGYNNSPYLKEKLSL